MATDSFWVVCNQWHKVFSDLCASVLLLSILTQLFNSMAGKQTKHQMEQQAKQLSESCRRAQQAYDAAKSPANLRRLQDVQQRKHDVSMRLKGAPGAKPKAKGKPKAKAGPAQPKAKPAPKASSRRSVAPLYVYNGTSNVPVIGPKNKATVTTQLVILRIAKLANPDPGKQTDTVVHEWLVYPTTNHPSTPTSVTGDTLYLWFSDAFGIQYTTSDSNSPKPVDKPYSYVGPSPSSSGPYVVDGTKIYKGAMFKAVMTDIDYRDAAGTVSVLHDCQAGEMNPMQFVGKAIRGKYQHKHTTTALNSWTQLLKGGCSPTMGIAITADLKGVPLGTVSNKPMSAVVNMSLSVTHHFDVSYTSMDSTPYIPISFGANNEGVSEALVGHAPPKPLHQVCMAIKPPPVVLTKDPKGPWFPPGPHPDPWYPPTPPTPPPQPAYIITTSDWYKIAGTAVGVTVGIPGLIIGGHMLVQKYYVVPNNVKILEEITAMRDSVAEDVITKARADVARRLQILEGKTPEPLPEDPSGMGKKVSDMVDNFLNSDSGLISPEVRSKTVSEVLDGIGVRPVTRGQALDANGKVIPEIMGKTSSEFTMKDATSSHVFEPGLEASSAPSENAACGNLSDLRLGERFSRWGGDCELRMRTALQRRAGGEEVQPLLTPTDDYTPTGDTPPHSAVDVEGPDNSSFRLFDGTQQMEPNDDTFSESTVEEPDEPDDQDVEVPPEVREAVEDDIADGAMVATDAVAIGMATIASPVVLVTLAAQVADSAIDSFMVAFEETGGGYEMQKHKVSLKHHPQAKVCHLCYGKAAVWSKRYWIDTWDCKGEYDVYSCPKCTGSQRFLYCLHAHPSKVAVPIVREGPTLNALSDGKPHFHPEDCPNPHNDFPGSHLYLSWQEDMARPLASYIHINGSIVEPDEMQDYAFFKGWASFPSTTTLRRLAWGKPPRRRKDYKPDKQVSYVAKRLAHGGTSI